jgi:hypothetical protein
MKSKPLSLRESLTPCVDLRFPDFEKYYENGLTAKAYAFESIDCREWHERTIQNIFDAIENRSFCPVYRLSHGEFIMALGYREEKLWHQRTLKQNLGILYRWLTNRTNAFRSGSNEYGYEEFSKEEIPRAKDRFLECLRIIAQKGILAAAFHDTPGYKAYIPEFLDWIAANQIRFDSANYAHFYSIYVLLHGRDRHRLFNQKRILVVTGLTEGKQEGIEKGLLREGAADVQFLGVSPSKALFDVLDLSSVRLPVDLVLVGAGVGSANIVVQLEPLQTACLDVGFCLSTIANPDLRWNRPLCIPDEEFDIARFPWISKGIKD